MKSSGKSLHTCKHERRIARQERAIERQKERDKRSAKHQLVLLKDRPGNSRKERSRLRKQLAAKR